MSLVVLRSWNEGSPPVVREIAKDSNNDSEIIVVPDHQGTFVTKEVSKEEEPIIAKENPVRPISWNRNKNPASPAGRSSNNNGQQQQLPTTPTNSLESQSSYEEINQLQSRNQQLRQLSRESSTLSNGSGPGTDQNEYNNTPPLSPSLSNSRYKNLGPELAATIPKRHILRNSWIRNEDDDDNSEGNNNNNNNVLASNRDPEY